MRVFVSHLLNENDVNIFETIETGHFNTSNYIRSVVGEIHLLNLINELLLFLSISLIFYIIILLHEKFLQFDWLRVVVFQLNLK